MTDFSAQDETSGRGGSVRRRRPRDGAQIARVELHISYACGATSTATVTRVGSASSAGECASAVVHAVYAALNGAVAVTDVALAAALASVGAPAVPSQPYRELAQRLLSLVREEEGMPPYDGLPHHEIVEYLCDQCWVDSVWAGRGAAECADGCIQSLDHHGTCDPHEHVGEVCTRCGDLDRLTAYLSPLMADALQAAARALWATRAYPPDPDGTGWDALTDRERRAQATAATAVIEAFLPAAFL